ncbi:MAG TPA: ABC transporter permease [Methylomirabilota bacterium]|nr:ABC transporter permease [Methylomirabilota bacterium]
MIFWKIALRNLWRNSRRSLITVTTIAVGLAGVIFLWGYIDGTNRQMVTNITRFLSGALQVQGRGYLDEMSFDNFLEDGPAVETLLRDDPAVDRFTPRIVFPVLLSSRTKSRGLLAMGIDPASETGVTTLHRTVAEGRFLASGDTSGILVGQELAESLKVRPGDELVILAQTAYGTLGSTKAPIIGILRTGTKEVDLNFAFLPLRAMQELLEVEQRVSTYALTVKEQAELTALTRRLESGLGDRVELITWRQLMPSIAEEIRFHEALAYFILAVVFVVVGAGIVNTIFMGVWERGREFGIMQALGTARGQIVRVVAYESLILAVAGTIAGSALGLLVTGYYGRQGIDLSRYAEGIKMMAGLSPVVFPEIGAGHLVFAVAVVFVVSTLAALYPALMATRLDPIAAIQQQRAIRAKRSPRRLRSSSRPIRRWVFAAMGTRNLFRNPRRSLITVSGIAFGMAGIFFLWALAEGYYQQIIENATGYETGHLQLSRAGFRQELTPDYSIQEPEALLARARELPGVVGVAPRIFTQALLGTGRKSTGGFLYGIDAVQEPSVTRLSTAVGQGRFLTASDRNAIVLGTRLADKLKAKLGEKVVVYAQASGGDLGAGAYRVVGILESGIFNLDAYYAFIPLVGAQQLLSLDRGITMVAVRLANRWQLPKATIALRGALPADIEVVPWQSLLPIVTQTIELLNVMLQIILLVVFVIVAMGVMNTILMSTLERTREIGIMMAVGTRRGQVAKQVFAESCFLAILGVAVGAVVGSAIAFSAGLRGIDLRPYMGQITAVPGFTGILRPVVLPETLAITALWLFVISLVVSVYPAWRISRLDPVDAIGRG